MAITIRHLNKFCSTPRRRTILLATLFGVGAIINSPGVNAAGMANTMPLTEKNLQLAYKTITAFARNQQLCDEVESREAIVREAFKSAEIAVPDEFSVSANGKAICEQIIKQRDSKQ